MSFAFVDASSLVDLTARLDGANEVEEAADESAEIVATWVAEKAHDYVPRRTGNLDGTIEVEYLGDGLMAAAAGGEDAPYAGPIHWGWEERNIEAQPFLWQAWKEVESDLDEDALATPVIDAVEAIL